MAKIFLCHANEDKSQVREVYQRLKAEGYEPWLDEEDILPGQLWDQEIRQALKNSDFILIFFSQTSVAKQGYVQREMKLTLEVWEEIPEGQIHTIPVRLDACEIPVRFERFQWADLFADKGFERIAHSIRAGLAQRQQMEPEASVVTHQPVENTIPQNEEPRLRLASDEEIRQYDHNLGRFLARVRPPRVHIKYDVYKSIALPSLDYSRQQLLWILSQIVIIKAKSKNRLP